MTTRRTQLDGLAVAMMIGCCLLWGLQQVVVKMTLTDMAPFTQGALRSAIAAAAVWAWSRARGIPLFDRDGTLVPGLVAGLLFALEFLCVYAALPLTDASRVSVFIYTAPFWVALALPWFVPEERLDRWQLIGLGCAFAALAYAFQEGFKSSTQARWQGDAIALVGAVFWASTTLVIRSTALARAVAEKTLFYQLAMSVVVLGITAWATGERWPAGGVSTAAWLSIGFQSLVVAFASFLAWFWLLRHYPATRLSAFSFLTPMCGLVFAAVVLHETIGSRLAIALLFVAIGIWLVNRRRASTGATLVDPST